MVKFVINIPEEIVENFVSLEDSALPENPSQGDVLNKLIGFIAKGDIMEKAAKGECVVLDAMFDPNCDEQTKKLQEVVLRDLFMASIASSIEEKKKNGGLQTADVN